MKGEILPKDIVRALRSTPSKGPHHPEETVYEHVHIMYDRFSESALTVLSRLGLNWDDLTVVQQAILYHDLGKIDTVFYNDRTGGYSFYGHEKQSLVRMKNMNQSTPIPYYNRVRWIVRNHIRIHAYTKGQMKNLKKIEKLTSSPDFKLLDWFEKLDDMLLDYQSWVNNLKEKS